MLMNFFRYVDRAEADCVELRLFRSADGNPQGDVSGPVSGFPTDTFSDVLELVRCSTLDDAFQAGIRMANKNDAELVVSGNPELWLAKWGILEQSAALPIALSKTGS